MTPPLVLVTWNDAHAEATECFDKAKHHTPAVITTVGWLQIRDKVGVSLANERSSDDHGGYDYRGVTFIPTGMVVKIERLS